MLLEKASAIGGRATTRDRHGFLFNLGPHALYRNGVLSQTLRQLGVEVTGAVPGSAGGFAIRSGRRHTLPVGLTSSTTTSVMALPAKFEFAGIQRLIDGCISGPRRDAGVMATIENSSRGGPGSRADARRVTTFTNDPHRQSAGAALEQLQLALNGSVLYLNGGWQTIVDGLRRVAVASGVQIEPSAYAVALERKGARSAAAVRLADGRAASRHHP